MNKTAKKIARYRALAKAEREFDTLANRARSLAPEKYCSGYLNKADRLSIECQINALETSEQRESLKPYVKAWLSDFKDPAVHKVLKRFIEGDDLVTAVRSVTKNDQQFDIVSRIVSGIIKEL